ncbi:MAG: hypothetical protein CM15mP49_38740 [Actinomycetota bacterium]|nr:MAG: hypothetical protein CM15mP49_38740 [Actinomycetota bacterium]
MQGDIVLSLIPKNGFLTGMDCNHPLETGLSVQEDLCLMQRTAGAGF